MLSVIAKSLRDFMRPSILFMSLLPITLAAIFWAIIFYFFWGQIDALLITLLEHIPFISVDWAKSAIELLGGVFVYYELLIVTAVMVVGLIADRVVDKVNARSYQLGKQGFGSLRGSMLISLRSNLFFVILFVLFLPTLFIPVVNIIVHLFLWVVLIRAPLFYDAVAMVATREEFRQLKKNNRGRNFLIAVLAASLFLIPVIGVFIYVLQLLFFCHHNLQQLSLMRAQTPAPTAPGSQFIEIG